MARPLPVARTTCALAAIAALALLLPFVCGCGASRPSPGAALSTNLQTSPQPSPAAVASATGKTRKEEPISVSLDKQSLAYARYCTAVTLDIEAARLEELYQEQRSSRSGAQPGLLAEARRKRSAAIEEIDKALALDPGRPEIMRRKGDIYIELDNIDRAMKLYRAAARVEPADERWYLRAAARLETADRPVEAAEILQEAVDSGRLSVELQRAALLELGTLYAKADMLPQAERAYRAAVKESGKPIGRPQTAVGAAFASGLADDPTGIRRRLVGVLTSEGKLDEALQEAHKAAKESPKDVRTLVSLASVYEARNEPARAIEAAESFYADNPANEAGVLVLMKFLSSQGRVDDAVARGTAFLAAGNDSPKVKQAIVAVYKEAHRTDDAAKYAESAKGEEAGEMAVSMALLDAYASDRKTEEAFKLGARILQENSLKLEAAVAVFRTIWKGLSAGDAEKFYGGYIADFPDDLRASYVYASLLAATGKQDEASELFVKVAEGGAHYAEAYVASALYLSGRDEAYRGISIFLSGVENGFIARPEAYVMEIVDGVKDAAAAAARLLADETKYSSAATAYDEVMAGLYLQADDNAKAETYYRKALESPLPQLIDSAGLAVSLYRQDKTAEAIALVEGLAKKGQGAPPLLRMLAGLLAKDGNFKHARAIAERLVREQPTDIDNHVSLANVCMEEGDYPEAERALLAARDLAEGDEEALSRVRYLLGAVYEEEGKDSQAEAMWRANLAADENDADAANALGYHYALRGTNLNEGLALLRKALKKSPDNAAYLDSLGWIYYKMGRIDSAVECLKKAAGKEADPVVLDHLGDALMASGDRKGALDAWEKALAAKPKPRDRASIQGKLDQNFPGRPI